MQPANPRRKAIFLDRDGVINRDSADFIKSPEEFEFLPGVLEALRRLAALPWPIIVISNQSGVGRGLFTEATLAEIHAKMLAGIRDAGGRIDAIYYCPHHPDAGCPCRKPSPGLLHQAAEQMHLDLQASWLIGDDWRDVQAATAAGVNAILLDSPKSRKPRPASFGLETQFQWAATLEEAIHLAAAAMNLV